MMTRVLLSLFLLMVAPVAFSAPSGDVGRIEVSASGEVSLVPDIALINLSVERRAESAEQALADNSAAMNKVVAALKEQGIADKDLQTNDFSIQPNYVYPRQSHGDQQPRIVGYIVRNSLQVRLRDLGRVGAVLEQAVSLGVNQGGNIRFTNDDTSAALSEARQQAVQRARAKAETLAQAAGVKLGRLLQLSDQQTHHQPIPLARAEFAVAADAPPIAAGENSYSVSVFMAYEILQ